MDSRAIENTNNEAITDVLYDHHNPSLKGIFLLSDIKQEIDYIFYFLGTISTTELQTEG